MRTPRKYPRIKAARQLKPIELSYTFPLGSRIVLDKKRGVGHKQHQLIWQQGAAFGTTGDICEYINHGQLFELAKKGVYRTDLRLMKIVAPKRLIQTIHDEFAPAPELEKFVKDNFLNDESKLYNEDHRHLRQTRIAYLWTNASNSRGGRSIVASAEIPRPPAIGGKWARAKWEYQMTAWFGHINFDFLITLNARFVNESKPIIGLATLDHELYHCGQKRDEYGAKMFGKKSGKPVYALLTHDVEEFVGIWRRYGAAAGAGESIQMAAAAKRKPEIGKADIRKVCGNCLD